MRSFVLLFVAALVSCRAPEPASGGRSGTAVLEITTEREAIAVARAALSKRGGDPERSEWSAKRFDDKWHVTAWKIFYPENEGAQRFVPGGFTTYSVGHDGVLLAERPGY